MQACWVLLFWVIERECWLAGWAAHSCTYAQTNTCTYFRLAVTVVRWNLQQRLRSSLHLIGSAHKSKNRSVETALCPHSHTHTYTQAYTSVKYHGPPFTGELSLGSWKTDSNHHLREWKAAERVKRGGTIGIGKYLSFRSWFLKLLVEIQDESGV